jgi:hypothetical protein
VALLPTLRVRHLRRQGHRLTPLCQRFDWVNAGTTAESKCRRSPAALDQPPSGHTRRAPTRGASPRRSIRRQPHRATRNAPSRLRSTNSSGPSGRILFRNEKAGSRNELPHGPATVAAARRSHSPKAARLERRFFKLNIFLILFIFGAPLALSTPLLSDWWGCLVADHIKSIISPDTQSRCATDSRSSCKS